MSYYNGSAYTFTWEGRRLVGALKGSTNMSFTYDDNGIRTSKTVNGVTHTYQLNGSQIVSESWEDKLIVYLYDASGAPIGMMYRTTSYEVGTFDVFWFEKNLQGDIVAVYNSTGTKVASYGYTDAWGNHGVGYYNGGETSGAQYNPFRYRGYYYDADLAMYYLQSRYYDPNTCRFVNADGALYHSMLGYNLFAYCENNPVNMIDITGQYCVANMDDDGNPLNDWNLEGAGAGGYGATGNYFGYGTSYYNYSVRSLTAAYDANLGGYHSSSISTGITNPSYYYVPGAVSVTDSMATDGGGQGKGFDTFEALKNHLGSAGTDCHWHHIVEQSQIAKSGFSPQQIHNTNNIVSVNKVVHGKISGYYTSKQSFTGGLSVRDWLAGKSFEYQTRFGWDIYYKFGGK